jgi:hypothetical protein
VSVIRVAIDILSEKEHQMNGLVMDYSLATQHTFNAVLVDEAYRELNHAWDQASGRIAESVEGIARVFRNIRQAFEQAESQLVNSLQQ